ncbi:GNAT family N-acetyltransferase [Pseudarthrobacter oxydans]|uniref:GNAT family N-acetyltransferase n=1 Tax=Pseudarthrobacter oxydans TaxID=1671 RepID=UPI00380B0D24
MERSRVTRNVIFQNRLHKLPQKDYCAGFLKSRRTLGGLAVDTTMRRLGLGRELLTAIEDQARSEGVHHLMGFIDARNGGPGFYAENNYTVLAANRALPRMGPFPVTEVHPTYLSGSWFYRVL